MSNITIRVDDEELVRRVKILAAKRGTSVSALVRAYLEDLVVRDSAYDGARTTALQHMREGFRMGGQPLSRDEVHDER